MFADVPINEPPAPEPENRDAEQSKKNAPPEPTPSPATLDTAPPIKNEPHTQSQVSEIREWGKFVVEALTLIAVIVYACIASHQLTAMVESNAISRSANIVSQRAFVFIPTDMNALYGSDPQTKQTAWMIGFKMQNSGNTPATIIGNHVNSNSAKWEALPDNFDFGDNPTGTGMFPNSITKPSEIVIAPHEIWGFNPLAVPDDVFDRVNQGKAHVYFWGWVSYTDIFGCLHRTEFAREIVSAQKPSPGTNRTFFLNSLIGHNCFDKSCKDYQPLNTAECPD